MGEVYRAKDTRLDRIVAIKVLPEHFAVSLERKARFVMEYIEGETLAHRLQEGSLGIDRAMEYGMQIADALDRAHRKV